MVFDAHVKEIKENTTNIEVKVLVIGFPSHGILKPQIRITGQKRKDIGTQLMAYGINNFQTFQNLEYEENKLGNVIIVYLNIIKKLLKHNLFVKIYLKIIK